MERRLAAILAADVVGYSRAMSADEAGTFGALSQLRKTVIEPLIVEHRGRVVKLMGDGILAEFASVVDAVRCAVAWQGRLAEADLRFRIGLNLGDVMVEDGDIYGTGVNVAARLEALADPGGLCVSGSVYDELQGKLDLAFADLGPQQVKNIAVPVRAYALTTQRTAPGGTTTPARPAGSSIAVLPFDNMSGDPAQDYFSDGITEDIITELSRFRSLAVVARNSCFTFKGRAADVKEVGRKLGARYVVEGSVRKAGARVRVTAQLIEAQSGNHLWAERYDRDLEDIFAVQDEVVRAIAGTIPGQLDRVALAELRQQPPSNLTAYDCVLRGRWAYNHWSEGLPVAIAWFEKAAAADPDYALAHAGLAMAYSYGLYVLGLPPEAALAKAREHAQRALALDDRNPAVRSYAALAYYLSGQQQIARPYAERAVALNPNDSFVQFVLGNVLAYCGEFDAALRHLELSERLEPYAPDDMRLDLLCDLHYMRRDYAKVVAIHGTYQKVPAFLYLILAAAHAQAGNAARASEALAEYERKRQPDYNLQTMIAYQMRMCVRPEDRAHWLEGYRKAGIEV